MDTSVLRLSNLSVGYRNEKTTHVVASAINASLKAGELVSLIGLNGAGKSTLLRTVSGFQSALSGKIEYCGCDFEVSAASQLSKLIAIVLTEREPLYNISVREVVSMGRMPYTGFFGFASSRDHFIIDNALSVMGIEKLADRPFDTLSDGERQKAMIAKAIAQETPIILLDEPTAFLDFMSRVYLMRTLRSLAHETGKAILLSTHDMELALQLSDKLWILDERKLCTGSVDELSRNGYIASFTDRDGIRYDAVHKRINIY